LAYLRLVVNRADSLSLKRVINTPPRGIGKTTLENVSALAGELKLPLFDAFREAMKRGLLKKTGGIKAFFEAFDSFKAEGKTVMDRNLPLHELALRLLEDSGYMGMWIEDGSEEALTRIENLHELISAIRDFENSLGSGGPGEPDEKEPSPGHGGRAFPALKEHHHPGRARGGKEALLRGHDPGHGKALLVRGEDQDALRGIEVPDPLEVHRGDSPGFPGTPGIEQS
jgi:superfamily I DNA/RNA helicase